MSGVSDTDSAVAYGVGLLTGPTVRLRALQTSDLADLEAWWNDPATLVLSTTTVRPQPAGPMRDTFEQWSRNTESTSSGFSVATLAGVLVGHITLWSTRQASRSAELAVVLGPPYVGQGYGSEAVRLMLRYGFAEIGLHRIELKLWSYNTRARAAYASAGFVEEGRRREVVFHDGAFSDEVLMSVLEHEWRAHHGRRE